MDEEGNVIAGEKVVVREEADVPVPSDAIPQSATEHAEEKPTQEVKPHENPTSISIHTIDLPARAPKQLLLDLKHVFETFPGSERIQLRIGEQMVPLPITVTLSPILQKQVDEVLEKYATA